VNGPSHPGAVGAPPAKVTPPPPRVPGGAHGAGGEAAPLTGWRDLLLQNGPAAWAQAVRAHPGVLLTDTTWRAPAAV
jgi:pyruvate carboxylase